MKKKNRIISFLLMALIAGSMNVFAGGGNNFVDEYKISPKENFEPEKAFQLSWEITYGESKRPVQVLLTETSRGDVYIVRTKYFEVKYIATQKGFGVRYVKDSEMVVPESLCKQVLNSTQMESQKVITLSKIDHQKALQLIAGFLPELVNEQYKNILN